MVTLIWHSNFDSAWENDWIEYLFQKVEHRTIVDYNQSLEVDNSVIIYNATVDNTQYLKRISQKGINFGLIHLSDEWNKDPVDHYPLAKFVLRNYYKDLGSNVLNFPLGWMKTFPELPDKHLVDRKLIWSFSGHVDKTTRPEMARWMATIPNGKSYFKRCGEDWGPFQGQALTPPQMAEMYNNSWFVPCPQGNCSIDSLRVCEALQAGAMPIVEKNEYWAKLYGADHPLIEIDSWKDAPNILYKLTTNLNELEAKRIKTYQWWKSHCNMLVNKITELI